MSSTLWFDPPQDDTPLPPGVYAAEFIAYEIKDHSYQDDAAPEEPRKEIEWTIRITQAGEFLDRQLRGWCSIPRGGRLSSRAKLTTWGTAILGDVSSGFGIEDLLHKPCQISIVQVPSTRGDGTVFAKIGDVFSATTAQPVSAPATTTQPAPAPAPQGSPF